MNVNSASDEQNNGITEVTEDLKENLEKMDPWMERK